MVLATFLRVYDGLSAISVSDQVRSLVSSLIQIIFF